MLLDIGAVLGGIALAAVAFLVVMLVCVVILRLLAAILPSYEDRDAARLAATPEPVAGDVNAPDIEAPVPSIGGADPDTEEADAGPR